MYNSGFINGDSNFNKLLRNDGFVVVIFFFVRHVEDCLGICCTFGILKEFGKSNNKLIWQRHKEHLYVGFAVFIIFTIICDVL